jgi:catechol 2,3-dioxygenase-like lactoylglutathione lyase family enzyme
MIQALAHVCILSTNLDRTRDFYCRILRLSPGFDFLRDGQLFGFYIKINDRQFIEVFKTGDEPSDRTSRLITHLCLETYDIDALSSHLEASDVATTKKKIGADQSWQIWCKDPDGTDIEFHQYTPASSQLTGTACHVDW